MGCFFKLCDYFFKHQINHSSILFDFTVLKHSLALWSPPPQELGGGAPHLGWQTPPRGGLWVPGLPSGEQPPVHLAAHKEAHPHPSPRIPRPAVGLKVPGSCGPHGAGSCVSLPLPPAISRAVLEKHWAWGTAPGRDPERPRDTPVLPGGPRADPGKCVQQEAPHRPVAILL